MAPRHSFGSKPPGGHAPNRRAAGGLRRRAPSLPSVGSAPPNRKQSPPPAAEPSTGRKRATAFGALLGALIGAAGLASVTWASGCGNEGTPPPGPIAESPSSEPLAAAPASQTSPEEKDAPTVEEPDLPDSKKADDEPEKPWEGPWLGALSQQTPIYPTARFSKNRMGYIRRGGKVPVIDKPIRTSSCKQGFYPLVDGGFVCGKYATTKIDDPRVKMGVKAPDIEALLPYKYAYNRKHGTPLYSAVPSKEEMLRYEPYLVKKDKKASSKPADKLTEEEAANAEKADQPHAPESKTKTDGDDGGGQFLKNGAMASTDGEQGGGAGSGGAAAEEVVEAPWWQRDAGTDVEVKLSDLDESDGTLAKRMVKGFFIAIDRTFGWNDRLWYKTTDGLIAPTDRMIIPKAPELKGIELADGVKQAGFIRASKAYKYERGDDGKMTRAGRIERYASVGLTGETHLFAKKRYRLTTDKWWMRDADGTWTETEPRPKEVGSDEKWIDVNLSRKTLMAFEGDTPVYAALISPGKRSKVKKRDHRTKTGKWRIREKHITTTMDGDGPAGDLPYSIQDVPYVQYYDGSYALHGAFWHNNFGREQSHGCVNLSPSDAKHLFFWSDPPLPRGWHGVWSSDKRKGTMVVVHE